MTSAEESLPFAIGGYQFAQALTLDSAKGLLLELGHKCQPRAEPKISTSGSADGQFLATVDVSELLGPPLGAWKVHELSPNKKTAEKVFLCGTSFLRSIS